MAQIKVVRQWLEKAEEDFGFAKSNLEQQNNRYFSQICFHFQQAAEKYLKSYIVFKDLDFRKIHDLTELKKICMSNDEAFEGLSDACIFLTDYYIDTRYPVQWPSEISVKEALEAMDMTCKIRDFVKQRIPSPE